MEHAIDEVQHIRDAIAYTGAVRHYFRSGRARAHAGLSRQVSLSGTKWKLGHHRSYVHVRTRKTGTDGARTRRTDTGAGKR